MAHSGAAIYVVWPIIGVFIVPVPMGEAPGWGTQPVVGALATLGTAALPVCLGVAVLKYRLYELNRIISRVVSYTVITALLGGVFIGLILLATHVLPVKGPVAVAVATLVIAALFNPLRKRVQHMVDRRFNRARYDAAGVEAIVDHGQLDHLAERLEVEGDLGTAFARESREVLVADVVGARPLRGEGVPGVRLHVNRGGRSGALGTWPGCDGLGGGRGAWEHRGTGDAARGATGRASEGAHGDATGSMEH